MMCITVSVKEREEKEEKEEKKEKEEIVGVARYRDLAKYAILAAGAVGALIILSRE